MSTPPFMQLYVSDYLGDTRGLTTEQHGAYLLLLMTAWNAGGRVPNDPAKLARYTGCTPSRWAKISADVLAYFKVDGDHLVSARLMFELEKASEKSIKRAVSGSLGGKAKALKTKKPSVANATVLPQHSPEPEPEPEDTPTVVGVVRARRPARICPASWEPSAKTVATLEAEGHSLDLMTAQLPQFRDYTFASAKTDWDATWRNWVRKSAPSRGGRSKNWRELEIENNENALKGAAMALELIENEHNGISVEPSQPRESTLVALPGPALPQGGAFAGRTSDLVEGLSHRLRAV